MTAALPPHMRQHGSCDCEQPEDIGAIDPFDLFGRRLLHRAQQAETGIVQQNIDTLEARNCAAGRFARLRLTGHVQRQSQQIGRLAEPADHGSRIAGGCHHIVTLAQCGFGDQRAKAAGRTGDAQVFLVLTLFSI